MVWELLLYGLSILGAIAFLAALVAIAFALRFRRNVIGERVWEHNAFLPRLLVLVPVRGVDIRLEGNLDAILSQEYPDYRVVFCVDSPDEPAAAVIERVRDRHPVGADVATAAEGRDSSGKALALLGGLRTRRPDDEALAFLDADIRPHPRFLRSLVQPLAHPGVGATTGYRWYVPVRGGFWSALRSAWNAAGLNIFFSNRYNFLWGGAWAVRTETLDRIDLARAWRGTLSEDLAVTGAIKGMGLQVRFVPQAVAPTLEDCDRRTCVEWTTWETAMVAVWGRHIRNFASLVYGVFDGSAILGVFSLALAVLADPAFLLPAALFLFDVPVAIANGEHRRRSVFLGSPGIADAWKVPTTQWALASLIVPWLIALNLLRTKRVRSIEWRGKRYDIVGGYARAAG